MEAVVEDEFVVAVGEGDIGGVERVGELDVETVLRPQRIGGGERGHDSDDLEEGAAVVAGDFGGGIHGVK